MTQQRPVSSTEFSASRADQTSQNDRVRKHCEIAHDLSNWLCCIELLVNSIPRDGSLGEDMADIATKLRHATSEAIDLCRDFLAGRKDTSENPPPERPLSRLDPGELLEELKPLMSVFVPKNATLHWHVDDRLPAIAGRATALKRVVVNLVLNASEALRAGRREITVRGMMTEAGTNGRREEADDWFVQGQFLVIEVSDTGCGMDEETVHNIFRSSFTSKSQGHGLGLASVKDTVEQHEGWIQVQSVPGEGTTVQVFLPCLSVGLPNESDDSAPGDVDRDSARSILVVDDQRLLRTVAARLLSPHGFDVTTTDSAEQAIEVLAKCDDSISVIVMDLRLPGISGCRAFEEIRLIRPDVPIVVMTGCSEEEIEKEFSGSAQPDAIVRKPFDLESMLTVLRAVGQRSDLATLAADG